MAVDGVAGGTASGEGNRARWVIVAMVFVAIMLNYVAFYLLLWMLRTPGLLQAPGSNQPQTRPTPESAQFPNLLGAQFPNLDWGFVVVIAATALAPLAASAQEESLIA